MSRTTELLAKLGQEQDMLSPDRTMACVPRAESQERLWPRFQKVRHAILCALSEDESDVQKEAHSQADISIYGTASFEEHAGTVKGIINDIEINMTIKGMTVEQQPILDRDMHMTYRRERSFHVTGTFISPDGRKGMADLYITDAEGSNLEAYWLEGIGGMTLQQVMYGNHVYDATKLPVDQKTNCITIPETDIKLPWTQFPKIENFLLP